MMKRVFIFMLLMLSMVGCFFPEESSGEADCYLINNTSYNLIIEYEEKLKNIKIGDVVYIVSDHSLGGPNPTRVFSGIKVFLENDTEKNNILKPFENLKDRYTEEKIKETKNFLHAKYTLEITDLDLELSVE